MSEGCPRAARPAERSRAAPPLARVRLGAEGARAGLVRLRRALAPQEPARRAVAAGGAHQVLLEVGLGATRHLKVEIQSGVGAGAPRMGRPVHMGHAHPARRLGGAARRRGGGGQNALFCQLIRVRGTPCSVASSAASRALWGVRWVPSTPAYGETSPIRGHMADLQGPTATRREATRPLLRRSARATSHRGACRSIRAGKFSGVSV